MSGADRGIILLAMALGALSLGFRLGWQDLWWDEEVTLMFSRMSWRELMVEHWGLDTHRPVYYALQKLWNGVAGESMVALRALPALITLLIVPVFYRIGREIGGRPLAALAALLLATAPMFVYQGRELRMYCLLNLCLALSLLFAIRLARNALAERDGREVTGNGLLVLGFSLSLALAFYAQAITAVVAVLYALWVGLALGLGILPLRFLRVVLIGAGLFVLFSIPAIVPFFSHYTGTVGENFWVPDPTPRYVYDQTLGTFPYPKWTKPPVYLLMIWGAWCLWRRQPAVGLLLLILVAGLPALLLLISLSKPLFMTRVIAWSGFVSILLLAAGLSVLPSLWRWVGAALVTAAQFVHLASFYPSTPEISLYEIVTEALDSFKTSSDIIIIDSLMREPALRWFHPDIFNGTAYSFPLESHSTQFLSPAFKSIVLLPSEVGVGPFSAERIFVLRSIDFGNYAPPNEDVQLAIERILVGRDLVESAANSRLKIEIYALP